MGVQMQLPPKPKHINDLEFVRILTPYVFTRHIASGRSVVDVGCGFGHGTWLLATNGVERVAALDLDEANVRRVSGFGGNFQNCAAVVMDAQRLGFRDHSFQLAACFEVIEHVSTPDMLLSELRRILNADGILVLTTPNRTVRLLPLQRPWNPEHLYEYTLKDLRKVLQKHFPAFAILGIYGDPGFYEHYRKKWQQSPTHGYLGWLVWIIRRLTPASVRGWIRNRLYHSNVARSPSFDRDLLNRALRDPVPKTWPFYVRDVGEDCLNFFAICGFDNQIIQRTVDEINESADRRSLF